MKKARIKKIAYIGWRGIDYEEIQLDSDVFTALIGPNGAGKSTLAMCLGYALLPDRKVLNIKQISEVQDPQVAGIDIVGNLIDNAGGYAYVVLDIATRHDERLIAGIQVTLKEGRGEFRRWYIKDAAKDISLQDIMRSIDGDEEQYLDLPRLSRRLAKSPTQPMVVKYDDISVGEYGNELYLAGVMPTNLMTGHERSLFARLIETTFRGGISTEVSENLKDYLLPPSRQLAESVSKLKDCIDDVRRTRLSVKDANSQLDIIESIYGVGKKAVLNALNRINASLKLKKVDHETISSELKAKQGRLDKIASGPDRLDQDINLATQAQKSETDNLSVRIDMLSDEIEKLSADVEKKKTVEKTTFEARATFRSAQTLWLKIAGSHSLENFEWLMDHFDSQISNANDRLQAKKQKISILEKDRAFLSRPSDSQSDALARMTGGKALGEVFESVSEQEALAVELSLGGITSGVVGCTPSDLADIEADENLPEVFWIGGNAPLIPKPMISGDWLSFERGDGGFTVFSKDHKPTFGSKARARRISEITIEISRLQTEISNLELEKKKVATERDGLLESKQLLANYLNDRNIGDRLEQDWLAASKVLGRTETLLNENKKARVSLKVQLEEIKKPHAGKIEELKEAKREIEQEIQGIKKDLESLSVRLKEVDTSIETLTTKRAAARGLLGNDYEQFDRETTEKPLMPDIQYSQEQTKLIDQLTAALSDEPEGRIELLQNINAFDEISYIRLWPLCNEILKDRIPTDVLDNIGQDLIGGMKNRRSHLDQQLIEQEEKFRFEARNIHQSLTTDIRTKKLEIKRLSKIGEALCFGNITGVRISVDVRQDILNIIREFSEQVPMFDATSRPVEEVMADFINNYLDTKIRGENVLDYRTYMELHLEILRKGADWKGASSLSGGESLGCGLAIGIMLARSLSLRGEIKESQINPLFIVDEIGRVDPDGIKTVIDFGRKEGFQVLVTALEFKPKDNCTVYAVVRVHEPKEQLVIRRVEYAVQELVEAE